MRINARTDVFLVGSGNLGEALERSAACAAAGADSLFVPGMTDPAGIAGLAAGPLPVAVTAGPGAPPAAGLPAAGVARISLGSAIARAACGVAARIATGLLATGTCESAARGIDYAMMNHALAWTAGV